MMGSIIYNERIKQGMKQTVLCKGICSVSYLSKIENMQATPSEEVIELLFKRLGITYITNVAYVEIESLFNEIHEAYLENSLTDQDINRFQEELLKLKYSQFYWEVKLHDLLLLSYNEEECADLLVGMPKEVENSPYYAIYKAKTSKTLEEQYLAIDLLLRVRSYESSGIIELQLLEKYFIIGKFGDAVKYGELALSSLGCNGYVRRQLSCHFNLALSYTYIDSLKAMEHYKSCIRINKIVDDKAYNSYIKYNMAAEYLVQFFRNEEDDNLREASILLNAIEDNALNSSYYYEKRIIVESLLGNIDSVKCLFTEVRKSLEEVTPHQLRLLEYISYNQYFYCKKEFTNILNKLFKESEKQEKLTRSLFIQDFLIFCYRKQNKYKAVYEISKFHNNR